MGTPRKTATRSVTLDPLSGPTMSSDFSTSIVLRSRLSAIFSYLDELYCVHRSTRRRCRHLGRWLGGARESDVLSDRSRLVAQRLPIPRLPAWSTCFFSELSLNSWTISLNK